MKTLILIVILTTLLAVVPTLGASIPTHSIIDQRCDETTGCHMALMNSIQAFSPIGQSFTPSGTNPQYLIGVEVYMRPSEHYNHSSTFSMKIIKGIHGPTLSNVMFTIGLTDLGWVFVPIPSVELIPNELYAFLVQQPTGDSNNWGIVSNGANSNAYAKGTWIIRGEEVGEQITGNDLAFRTYVAVPEPSSLIALGALLTPLLALRRRR